MSRSFAMNAIKLIAPALGLLSIIASPLPPAMAQVVPGMGYQVRAVGDKFEDIDWKFIFNWPKSSDENDKQTREPGGRSANDLWYEGIKRGQPDVIRRVPTPPGGLLESEGALLLASRYTGIPGAPSGKQQQDDFIHNVRRRMGPILVGQTPSVVVRVFVPEFKDWEPRTGVSFGFRVELEAYKKSGGFFAGGEKETYWPGIFIHFNSRFDGRNKKDSAHFIIRSDPRGFDIPGPKITETGWWTLGISITPDGKLHYYARQGIEDLTRFDHIESQWPYGFRALHMNTFFFNVANRDDGRSWSTSWVIDDPTLYVLKRRQTAERRGRRR